MHDATELCMKLICCFLVVWCSTIAVDKFTGALFDIYDTVRKEGVAQVSEL